MADPVLEQLRPILANLLRVDANRVVPTASLRQDLGADSLDLVELGFMCQEEFGSDITDREAAQIITVLDVVELVTSKQPH